MHSNKPAQRPIFELQFIKWLHFLICFLTLLNVFKAESPILKDNNISLLRKSYNDNLVLRYNLKISGVETIAGIIAGVVIIIIIIVVSVVCIKKRNKAKAEKAKLEEEEKEKRVFQRQEKMDYTLSRTPNTALVDKQIVKSNILHKKQTGIGFKTTPITLVDKSSRNLLNSNIENAGINSIDISLTETKTKPEIAEEIFRKQIQNLEYNDNEANIIKTITKNALEKQHPIESEGSLSKKSKISVSLAIRKDNNNQIICFTNENRSSPTNSFYDNKPKEEEENEDDEQKYKLKVNNSLKSKQSLKAMKYDIDYLHEHIQDNTMESPNGIIIETQKSPEYKHYNTNAPSSVRDSEFANQFDIKDQCVLTDFSETAKVGDVEIRLNKDNVSNSPSILKYINNRKKG